MNHRFGTYIACALLVMVGAAPCPAAEDDEGVSLTVYNQNFAVVKEQRWMDLRAGASTVKFPEVAATIVPDTVQFTALRPAAAKVLEQNYEFDLVSADKLLARYIDKPIQVIGRDGGLIEGRLLSADAAQLVLTGKAGVDLVPRGKNVKDIRFSSLPEGLLTRPTLVWKVRAEQAGKHLVKIAYRAGAITWRVDYRAAVAADEKSLDLAGWVTITNQSGTAYKDAGLKLMAGDVNVVPDNVTVLGLETRTGVLQGRMSKGEGFQEKAFAEYHLYTLGRQTTLASNQTKQIELITVAGIPVTKQYVYRPEFGNRVAVAFEFKNAKETAEGLGIPLPKGPVRVYQRGADGEGEFVGADALDHTPKDEPIRIRTGFAFDLAAERVQTDNRQPAGGSWNEQDWKITLRNHKDRPVVVVVEEPLQAGVNWSILNKSQEFLKKDANTIAFTVELAANSQATVKYTVRYTDLPPPPPPAP